MLSSLQIYSVLHIKHHRQYNVYVIIDHFIDIFKPAYHKLCTPYTFYHHFIDILSNSYKRKHHIYNICINVIINTISAIISDKQDSVHFVVCPSKVI